MQADESLYNLFSPIKYAYRRFLSLCANVYFAKITVTVGMFCFFPAPQSYIYIKFNYFLNNICVFIDWLTINGCHCFHRIWAMKSLNYSQSTYSMRTLTLSKLYVTLRSWLSEIPQTKFTLWILYLQSCAVPLICIHIAFTDSSDRRKNKSNKNIFLPYDGATHTSTGGAADAEG